ncbi:MAG: hypothetical protein Q7S40_09140 [Opitutaceae bacterium]|nr:hypothetical protein [Opitutaceae bacterium]
MPLIESANPADVVTPLQPLFPKVLKAAYMVAPDRQKEITDVMARHNLRIQLHENTGEFTMEAVASPFYPRLSVGLGSLERVWAAAFGYIVLFEISAEQHRKRRAGKPVGKASHIALVEATTLLNWAFVAAHEGERLPWPDAPSPSHPFPSADLMRSVETNFIAMVGWMLLHEIGHFACGHCDPVDSSEPAVPVEAHRREHEADHWAHAQMTAVADPMICRGNICSIPFALGVIAGINHRATDSHPSLANRLKKYMTDFASPLAASQPDVRATVNMTAVVPLQALIALGGTFPANLAPFPDLNGYLEWWERTME